MQNNDFYEFLMDVLNKVKPFRADIPYILLKQTGKNIKAIASTKDASLLVEIESKKHIPEFDGIACLGSLQYLSSILSTPSAKEGNLEMVFDTYNDKKLLTMLVVKGKNGFKGVYQLSNPDLKRISKVPQLKMGDDDFSVFFILNEDVDQKLDEMYKITKSMPKSTGDLEGVFTMVFEDEKNGITATFGERNSETSIVLIDNASTDDNKKVVSMFSLEKFRQIVMLVPLDDSTVACMCEKALRVIVEGDVAEYKYTLTAKKKRDI